ncbi:hypothetical protein BaRGS_00024074 [Batillaria attramentaria]|uniref:Uncharacterized protein n=1 Tax=Batillaria attramentaria TaxID=370345 RepID=A0ABD0KC58_9CAEN
MLTRQGASELTDIPVMIPSPPRRTGLCLADRTSKRQNTCTLKKMGVLMANPGCGSTCARQKRTHTTSPASPANRTMRQGHRASVKWTLCRDEHPLLQESVLRHFSVCTVTQSVSMVCPWDCDQDSRWNMSSRLKPGHKARRSPASVSASTQTASPTRGQRLHSEDIHKAHWFVYASLDWTNILTALGRNQKKIATIPGQRTELIP